MRQPVFAGIDPGMNKAKPGAWAIINEDLTLAEAWVWPKDGFSEAAAQWHRLVEDYAVIMCVLERQQVMPKQGAVTGGKIMENYGQWQGLLSGLRVPHRIENAKAWQAHILDAGKGRHKGRDAVKAASTDHARRMFPEIDFSLVKYQGKADALNMALYARKIFRHL